MADFLIADFFAGIALRVVDIDRRKSGSSSFYRQTKQAFRLLFLYSFGF